MSSHAQLADGAARDREEICDNIDRHDSLDDMALVNVHEVKGQLSRLLERLFAGEEIVITKAGKPCARNVPLGPPPQRVLGRYRDRDGEVPDSVFAPLAQELGACAAEIDLLRRLLVAWEDED